MKSLLLSTFLIGMAGCLAAQQLHFVYLQTDSSKPFYVSLNKKNYSSSGIGYIILSKLPSGDYPVRIGFPKSDQPEQEFLLQIKDNDQGFLIKDFGDKGLGLFNLQSMNVQYAGEATSIKEKQLAVEKEVEDQRLQKEAASLQAAETRRINDSLKTVAQSAERYADSIIAEETAIRQKTADSLQNAAALVSATEKAKKNKQAAAALQEKNLMDSLNNLQKVALENERLEKIADSTARVQAEAVEKAKLKKTVPSKKETLPVDSVPPHLADADIPVTSGPVLLQKTFTDTGWLYVYVITNNGISENIDVFIPYRQPLPPVIAAPAKTEETPVVNIQEDTVVPETKVAEVKKADPAFLDISFENGGTDKTVIKPDTVKQDLTIIHNSNCRAVANEKDFLALRKRMVSADDNDNMIFIARKTLKEKCFTTEQIRNLCVLFLTEEGRYQFLDAAYPFAFDAYRYKSLQDLLKEDYYIQRFKAMIH